MDSVVVNLTETSKGDIIEQTQVYFLSHSHNPVGSPSIRLVRDQGGEIRTFFFFLILRVLLRISCQKTSKIILRVTNSRPPTNVIVKITLMSDD